MIGPGIADIDRAIFTSDFVPAGLNKDIWIDVISESLSEIRSGYALNNLRDRKISLVLEDKNRGKAFERALSRILYREHLNSVRGGLQGNSDIDLILKGIDRDYTVEIKTSTMPDFALTKDKYLSIGSMILLVKTGNIDTDISGRDIYIQGIYDVPTKQRDPFCESLEIDIEKISPEEVYNKFKYEELSDRAFFVSWAPKQHILRRWPEQSADQRFWTHGNKGRKFYRFPIAWSMRMAVLDDFLRYGEKCYIF